MRLELGFRRRNDTGNFLPADAKLLADFALLLQHAGDVLVHKLVVRILVGLHVAVLQNVPVESALADISVATPVVGVGGLTGSKSTSGKAHRRAREVVRELNDDIIEFTILVSVADKPGIKIQAQQESIVRG
ncbi:hypothetical protein BN1723_007645 [Verticillium longisporum]|uniref:Uncharacterized protein n=1 Tax=Verticillium longisporum TaxID=100787 RepID=A0A0G4NM89_VERLO|nr:hypothetical protein BN1723_007645 [Verticillium longisporum]